MKNNYGTRIAPDRVSSGPTRFTGSVAMDFMSEYAPIDSIEANRAGFDAQSRIFFEIHEDFRSILSSMTKAGWTDKGFQGWTDKGFANLKNISG